MTRWIWRSWPAVRLRPPKWAVASASSRRPRMAAAGAGGGDQARVVPRHDGDPVGALDQRQRLADGRDQVAVVVMGDQVGEDLGVGLGAELHARRAELLLEGGEVLDDAVVDDGD